MQINVIAGPGPERNYVALNSNQAMGELNF